MKKRVIRKLRRAASLGTTRWALLRRRNGISEDDLGQAILVCGIRVGDVGLGFLEFGLAEFDDGAETLSSWHGPWNANLPIGAVNHIPGTPISRLAL